MIYARITTSRALRGEIAAFDMESLKVERGLCRFDFLTKMFEREVRSKSSLASDDLGRSPVTPIVPRCPPSITILASETSAPRQN